MATLNINGHDHSVDVPNDTPLLWVIREHLQMTGTKFGCGAGLCGACTVHLNGEAVRSCQTVVSQAAGKKIGRFDVNEALHAYYREAGQLYFLCALQKGLEFPEVR